MSRGSLTVVGTGIRTGVHLTPESRAAIESADELLYVATDSLAAEWLESLHPRARSLHELYREDELRVAIYEAMIEEILGRVRAGSHVCAAFYGHPGVFVYPSHRAIESARAEGFEARMLPAISAEDCLFADLGVDPASSGCQTYEATDFLIHRRRIDPSAALVLWQIGLAGQRDFAPGQVDRAALAVLTELLLESYPPDHEVTVYEASPYPIADAQVTRVPLAHLADAPLASASTLYVPPSEMRPADQELLARLGLSP